jgi:hypothetical protein
MRRASNHTIIRFRGEPSIAGSKVISNAGALRPFPSDVLISLQVGVVARDANALPEATLTILPFGGI